jgi:hypothetical protein
MTIRQDCAQDKLPESNLNAWWKALGLRWMPPARRTGKWTLKFEFSNARALQVAS